MKSILLMKKHKMQFVDFHQCIETPQGAFLRLGCQLEVRNGILKIVGKGQRLEVRRKNLSDCGLVYTIQDKITHKIFPEPFATLEQASEAVFEFIN